MTPAQAEYIHDKATTAADLAAEAQERAIEATDDLHPCMITGDGVRALDRLLGDLEQDRHHDPRAARLYVTAREAFYAVCAYDRRRVFGGGAA